jgi:hypothetical protein
VSQLVLPPQLPQPVCTDDRQPDALFVTSAQVLYSVVALQNLPAAQLTQAAAPPMWQPLISALLSDTRLCVGGFFHTWGAALLTLVPSDSCYL